jgi:hypothetical protein
MQHASEREREPEEAINYRARSVIIALRMPLKSFIFFRAAKCENK